MPVGRLIKAQIFNIGSEHGAWHAFFQGDVLREVEFVEYATEEDGIVANSGIASPLTTVLIRVSDLKVGDRVHRHGLGKIQDDWRVSFLVAPISNLKRVPAGTYLPRIIFRCNC